MNSYYNERSVRHPRAGRFLLLLLLSVISMTALTGCRDNAIPQRLSGQAQGTYYSIQYFDPEGRDLQPQIDSLLNDFDLTASLWVDSSLLRRVNRNETTSITPLFADLLDKSLAITEYTDGAFDCRIGRIVQLWGFSFRERQHPDSLALDSLLRAAHATVSREGLTLLKASPATELDFNAIAQGYSADLVGRLLDSNGIHNYLVDIGGEVVARGGKPDGRPWRVGIERPAADSMSAPVVQTSIALRDASVVTSGNYRKYYEEDGVRYSHTIDPATGHPVRHSLLSVSVVERESWLADALATAYMVMGLDSARAFIAAHPNGPGTDAVLFIYDSCGTLKEYSTQGFIKLEKQ